MLEESDGVKIAISRAKCNGFACHIWDVEERFDSYALGQSTIWGLGIVEEIWKRLIYPKLEDQYNHYEVSTSGRIKNVKTGKILKTDTNRTGYCTVRVCTKDRNTKIHIIVHKAVAYTFIDNPSGYKEINHKDANRENNNVLNLEWCTANYNQKYKYVIGSFDVAKISGENNHNAKLDWKKVAYIRENYKKGDRVYGACAMARKFGVSKVIVLRIIHNKGWINKRVS